MDKRKEDKLPASWVKTTVGEICSKIVDGSHNPPAKRNDGIPMLSARNIENGRIEFNNFRYISLRDYEIENARTQISFNDVLLTIVGSIGRTSVVPENARPFALQRSVAVLKPIEVLPKFCMYQFQSHAFQSNLMSAAQGTAQKGIYLKRLANLPFIIAPLAEQQRIVEEIEMQFSRLDEAVKSIKRMQKNLQRLRRTILQWACEGKLVATEAELARLENRIFEPAAELLEHSLGERYIDWEAKQLSKTDESGKSPKGSNWKTKYCDSVVPNTKDLPEISEGWVWVTIEQLASFESNSITDGPFGSNLKSEHYTDEGPRVIRLQNIGDGVFHDVPAHISQEHFERLKKHQVKEGDIVIAALGEVLPRACIIPEFVREAIVKADCIRFSPNPNLVNNEYVNFALNSELVRSRMTSMVHGVGRPRLNLTEIKAIAIPLPPLTEQKRIVAEVNRRLSVIESLESIVKTNLQRAEKMRRKILQDAFAGKLVEQNTNDEPVSVLLERIKNERVRRQAESKRKPSKKLKTMKRKKTERREIIEVLKEVKFKMTPEQLFHESGFNSDEVEEFYAELKKADNAKTIEQKKDTDGSVYLTATV